MTTKLEAEVFAIMEAAAVRAQDMAFAALKQTTEYVLASTHGDKVLGTSALLIMLRVQSAHLEALATETMSRVPKEFRAWLEPGLERYTLARYSEAEDFIAEAKAQHAKAKMEQE